MHTSLGYENIIPKAECVVRYSRWEQVENWGCEGVLTLQCEDWFRLGVDPSVHSAVSVLLDCLLLSYSFSYMEKKSLEAEGQGWPTHSHQEPSDWL